MKIDSSYIIIEKRFVWLTALNAEIYVDKLSDDHIKNIYNLLKKDSFHEEWNGISKHKWRMIIQLEMSRRVGYSNNYLRIHYL